MTASVTPIARATIGGSTAAAACGIDPHHSRVALWLEMTGRVTTLESEPMKWGKLLEPVIFDELTTRGYEAFQTDISLHDPERAWLVGHPDGFTYQDATTVGVAEIKTANAWAHRSDRTPLVYEAQVQTYLHLSGLDNGLLACLVGGQRLEVRAVERSDAAIEMMLELMAEFMGYVESDEPPPPDASKSARDALFTLYPEHTPEKVRRLTRAEYELVRELRELRGQRDVIEVQVAERENLLRAWMGDAEKCIGPNDEDVATWRSYTERRIDGTRLRVDLPETATRYTNETQRRRFTLS